MKRTVKRNAVKTGFLTTSGSAKRKIASLAMASCCLGFGAFSVGCVTPPVGIPVITGIEQDDIPVPVSFQFVESESPDYGTIAAGNFRSWKGMYRGGGRLASLVPWYVQEMKKLDWAFTRLADTKRNKTLYFEKPGEYAVIQLSRELTGATGSYANIVRAEIHPLGPEDYSVETNLENLRQSNPVGQTRPASYSLRGPGAPQPMMNGTSTATDPAAWNGPRTAPGAPAIRTGPTATSPVAPTPRAAALEEINRVERH